ncbi:hypothetical protein ABGB14_08610 [Nonomuraea sp. B10E15]|uniref:hypothetical protein n=1 Tax=Nonomuraea sp. B10E15 TaxID=3153560 RepID=UPI00325DF53C
MPPNMRIGAFSMGLLGLPLALVHDKIVGDAENAVTYAIARLHEHRDRLHEVAGNIEIADKRNEEHVRRI